MRVRRVLRTAAPERDHVQSPMCVVRRSQAQPGRDESPVLPHEHGEGLCLEDPRPRPRPLASSLHQPADWVPVLLAECFGAADLTGDVRPEAELALSSWQAQRSSPWPGTCRYL